MADVKKLGSPQVARPVVAPAVKKAATAAPPPAPAKATGWAAPTGNGAAAKARATATSFDKPASASSPAPVQALKNARAELAYAQLAQKLPLATQVDRRVLVAEASQYNPLSKVAGNGNVICAAAATVNALILSSKDSATCAANATALKTSADKLGAWDKLPRGVDRKDVEAALENFKTGAMKPVDVWNLQQLAWAQLSTISPTSTSDGVKPGVLGSLVSQLANDNAQFNGARFTETAGPKPGDMGHWTVVADGTWANSGERVALARNATAADGPDASRWDADVRAPVGKAAVKVQISDGAGQVTAFQLLPMFVATPGPSGLAQMVRNADNSLHFGESQGSVPREK